MKGKIMRILVIGGTRFMGPYVVQELHDAGHEIAVFHREQTPGAYKETDNGCLNMQRSYRSSRRRSCWT